LIGSGLGAQPPGENFAPNPPIFPSHMTVWQLLVQGHRQPWAPSPRLRGLQMQAEIPGRISAKVPLQKQQCSTRRPWQSHERLNLQLRDSTASARALQLCQTDCPDKQDYSQLRVSGRRVRTASGRQTASCSAWRFPAGSHNRRYAAGHADAVSGLAVRLIGLAAPPLAPTSTPSCNPGCRPHATPCAGTAVCRRAGTDNSSNNGELVSETQKSIICLAAKSNNSCSRPWARTPSQDYGPRAPAAAAAHAAGHARHRDAGERGARERP
jgi:hypothetical protein